MKLKLDEAGHVVVSDGKPVYVRDDGSEVAFDAPGTVATITRLNGEAKGHREAKEAAETKLKAFEGITDAAAAKKALETLANLDAKKLVDAGEVEKVKAEAIKAVEERFAPVAAENEKLKGELYAEKIGGAFARSKIISEKFVIPADMVQARFGQSFKLEDGKVVAYDQNGNKIFSKANPGELASFDEALDTLVSSYPYKDHILKGTGGNGSGSRNGSGSGDPGKKQLSREEFGKLPPADQMSKMRDGYTLVD
ncbi:ribosomal protein L14 [Xanthobacter flavus]|uniref:Ribosomal protein L14 n=1 Tax=Xanthobacter flavus TaxID=281 RepID=A0A9W6FMI9_XANFL|nr:DUF6651 domain-containing protein [Xanthobacter flavus]MDR6334503.1 ribosomal protein L14 [Xanthobacter flavus]GLI23477.1 hypothetical protein XFLAVUS301_31510 [Xanthobacter flavus]